MRIAAVIAVLLMVPACSDFSMCPDGQEYVSDPPIFVPVFNGKTTTMQVVPQGHCEDVLS